MRALGRGVVGVVSLTQLRKPVTRLCGVDRRELVVTLDPGHNGGTLVILREKRSRHVYAVTLNDIYRRAVAGRVAAELEQRRGRRR